MKVVIVGGGALGSLLGTHFVRGGADVTIADLPDVARQINSADIEIRKPSGESFQVRLRAEGDPAAIQEADLLLFCVKTNHTRSAVASMLHLKDQVGAVLSVQNGVDKERILCEAFGEEKVIGGCTLEGASRLDASTVLHTMSVITYLGELDGRITPRVENAVKLFTDSGLKAEASRDVVGADWCKWINFAAAAAVCALTRLPYYRVLLNPLTAGLMVEVYREYAGLAKASGVTLGDYPGFEVKTISTASAEDAVKILQQRGHGLLDKGATKVMPSLAQDVLAGRPTESESIFGFAVREGQTKGLDLPFTRHAYLLLSAMDQSLTG